MSQGLKVHDFVDLRTAVVNKKSTVLSSLGSGGYSHSSSVIPHRHPPPSVEPSSSLVEQLLEVVL